MAVLDAYSSIKVQIVVNGVPLQEYDDDEESATPGEVVKYVEAASGAVFEIQHKITPRWPRHDLLFQYFVDENYTGGIFITKDR